MAIYLDDEPTALTGDDLASVLVSARKQVQPDGRVVVEIQVDGEAVAASELDKFASLPVADREVRLYSADPKTLGRQTLEQVRPRLAEVKQIQEQAAEHLQQDQGTEAMTNVRDMIEIWLQAQQAVLHTAVLLEVDLNELEVDGRPFQEITNELLEKLQEVKTLLQNQDSVGLADTLQYEWPALADQWDRLLASLIARF
ncbi:hypothetical protein ACERK3_00055 [Phycisphaerales bacterium AB-hyl4]|uniref:Halobacterial output domain-containing protein n=1 Tax=Natronomicrosphaera hydrolytica TaxID=3242702 RepID=A0ABV4U1D2_9BACT